MTENETFETSQKSKSNNKINDRIDILETLLILIDELKKDTLSEISYLRLKSGIEFLIYELKHVLEFGLNRQLLMDDISAKDIADMTKIRKNDNRDIIVKEGIDIEIEFICNFVEDIMRSEDKKLTSKEMVNFVKRQFTINKKIEKFYGKR